MDLQNNMHQIEEEFDVSSIVQNKPENSLKIDYVTRQTQKRMKIEEKCDFSLFDPLVDKTEAENLFRKPLSNSIEDTLKKSDCVLVLCGHDEFRQFPKNKMKQLTNEQCIFLDGRNSFDKKDIQDAGFIYQGIGK